MGKTGPTGLMLVAGRRATGAGGTLSGRVPPRLGGPACYDYDYDYALGGFGFQVHL